MSYTPPTTWSAGTVSTVAASMVFSNSNGVSFGLDGRTITGSHNGLTSQSNQALSGSNTSFTFQTATFGNSNAVSFYVTNGSMVASVSALSTQSQQVVSAANGNFTWQTLSFSDGNGISFSTTSGAGPAIIASYAPVTISEWGYTNEIRTAGYNTGTTAATGGSSQTTASFFIAPLQLAHTLSFYRLNRFASNVSAGGTGSCTNAHMLGLYTLNAGTRLDSVSTWLWNHINSQNSSTAQTHQWWFGTNSTSNSSGLTGNVSASVSDMHRIYPFVGSTTLSPGYYWIVDGYTGRSSNAAVALFSAGLAGITTMSSYFALGDTGSLPTGLYQGAFSTTSNGTSTGYQVLPATIHTSVISTSPARIPIFWFNTHT